MRGSGEDGAVAAASPPEPVVDAGLLVPGRRPLTIGLVLIITAVAFEALAVSTALPVVADELDGVRLYGWAFSGFMLANLVGITLGGPLADRVGPRKPMLVGLALFSAGLLVSGFAPTMLVVVLGRLIAGAGSGAVVSTVYVVIGLGYPQAARARLFAVVSSAWVLPALFGPVLAGAMAESWLTWRSVFLVLAPLMVLDAALVIPGLRGIPGPSDHEHAKLPVSDAIRLSVGTGVLLAGLGSSRAEVAAPLAIVGVIVAWRPLLRLLPPGTLRACGALPTAVAMRGLLGFAFFTFDAFLPLTLTSLRGQSATRAGLSLTAAGLSWATGSWVCERRGARWGRRRTVMTGVSLILVGMAVSATVLWSSVPVVIAPIGWLAAGLGMGLCYPTFSLIVLEEAPEGRVGSASSALMLCDMLGVAVGTGLAGAAVALSVAADWGTRPGIEAADAMTIAVCLLALMVARRLPARPSGDFL